MADDEKPTTLFLPDGRGHRVGSERQERVELRAGVVEWFRQWADVGAALSLGVHCGKCGQDVRGLNSDTDRVFSLSCSCREFVGPNRDWRANAPVSMH